MKKSFYFLLTFFSLTAVPSVIQAQEITPADQGKNTGHLLTVDIELPIVGNTSLKLLPKAEMPSDSNVIKSSTSGGTNISSGGLLSITTEKSILGDNYIGVAEATKTETPDYKKTDSSLLTVNTKSTLLGDNHLGVLEYQQKETASEKTVSGGLIVVNPKPVNEIPKPNENKTEQAIPEITYKNKQPGFEESIKLKNARLVLNAGNKSALNRQTNPIELNNSTDSPENGNANAGTPVQISSATVITNSSGSASSSGSSSSPHAGSGIDSFLDVEFSKELAMNSNVLYVIKELSDIWINAPPIKPPQESFFLSLM